jgi:short-subunit dehydrogenase
MSLPAQRTGGSALVTGASSGIGEQLARQLAERGYNLVLVARREQRLSALADELRRGDRRIEVLPTDLADPDAVRALPERIARIGLEVDLLVNNAGFGTVRRFADTTLESQVGQIRVNCEALVTLTHAYLPAMLERRSGAIINVASSAGFQPLPYEAVYAATKAFALNFSDALHMETRGTGVSVLAVNPGPVPTEWQEIAGLEEIPKLPPNVSAEQVAREALEAAAKGKRSVIPGLGARVSMLATMPVPRALKLRVMAAANRPGGLRHR